MLGGGDCDFFEDPDCNAREAFPLWQPDPDITLSLVPDEDPETIAPVFNLWTMHGHKVLEHDGRRLILKLGRYGRFWQVCIASALDTAMPFTFAVAPGDHAAARLREAHEMLTVLAGQRGDFVGGRGAAEPIITMQSLQALDGHLAGASERDIAIAIFGQRAVSQKWHGDSEMRAKVRYLIRRGHKMMDGGYRSLLWGESARRAGPFSMTPTAGRKSPRDVSPYRPG
jgi:hypothetical protein